VTQESGTKVKPIAGALPQTGPRAPYPRKGAEAHGRGEGAHDLNLIHRRLSVKVRPERSAAVHTTIQVRV